MLKKLLMYLDPYQKRHCVYMFQKGAFENTSFTLFNRFFSKILHIDLNSEK